VTLSLEVRKAFRHRNLIALASLSLVIALTAGSSIVTQFDWPRSFSSFPKAIGWMAANFVPNERALKNAPKIAQKLAETLLVSVMASVLAGALAVRDDSEVMLLTAKGQSIRTRVGEIRETGRGARGVKLVTLSEGDRLLSIARIVETEEEGGAEA